MFLFGDYVKIHNDARFNVKHGYIGSGTIIGKGVLIEGYHVEIGREAFLDEGAHIGGGSCMDPGSSLVAGDFLHMGKGSHINIARTVSIGDECGIGINTKIFSHGAYQSAWDGFPAQFKSVHIGNRVWLPNAWVNPGVTIGSDVVVAAMSLVNKNLPAGCLAGGVPAKILKEDAYPRKVTPEERKDIWNEIWLQALKIDGGQHHYTTPDYQVFIINGEVGFDLYFREIQGPATSFSSILKSQLRRYGIRFRYEVHDGEWRPWATS